jgi:hypothetical protein
LGSCGGSIVVREGGSILALDLNEDGRTDAIAVNQDTIVMGDHGMLLQFLIMGPGGFSLGGATLVTPASGWLLYAGDFNADGFDDLVGYRPSSGRFSLFAGLPNDNFFAYPRKNFGALSPKNGWTFLPGDFNSDGRLDLLGYRKAKGTFTLCRNTGSALKCDKAWGATPNIATDWQLVAGRFHEGSSRPDVAGYRPSNGALWVGRNTGSKLVFTKWNTMKPKAGWKFLAGYFSRSIGHTAPQSLFGFRTDNGHTFIGRPVGTAARASELEVGEAEVSDSE